MLGVKCMGGYFMKKNRKPFLKTVELGKLCIFFLTLSYLFLTHKKYIQKVDRSILHEDIFAQRQFCTKDKFCIRVKNKQK